VVACVRDRGGADASVVAILPSVLFRARAPVADAEGCRDGQEAQGRRVRQPLCASLWCGALTACVCLQRRCGSRRRQRQRRLRCGTLLLCRWWRV
jgi:hypothetical protein